MSHSTKSQALALVAMGGLVVLAAVVLRGSENRAGAGSTAPSWADRIEAGADHVSARELADRMLAGDPRLAIVDVRPREEFAAWHLPGAIRLDVAELLGSKGQPVLADRSRLVVLYSNGPTHPGQAWVELARRGMDHVRVLDGGLDAFKDEVLTPPSLRGLATEAQSKQEATEIAIARAYFLRRPGTIVQGAGRHATDPQRLEKPTVVSARWAHGRAASLRFVDARDSTAEFAAWHLPGAVHLPQQSLRSKAGDRDLFLQPAEKIAARLGELGIEPGDEVVIYAEDKMHDATQVALAFLRVGHDRLAILEGGLVGWAAERLPLSREVTRAAPRTYTPKPGADRFTITIDELATSVRSGTLHVLDVRPPEFFRGDKSTEKRPGHIPGAINRFFGKDLVRGDAGHFFRERGSLLSEYASAGITKDKPVVVSCRTGHSASESYFVLRYLLGYEDVRWFNGSWTEWAAREDLPAERGAAAMSKKTALSPELLERVAAQFKALSVPSRLVLLRSLFEGRRSVGELVVLSGLSLANVSKHLGILHQAGLVTRRKAGLSVGYALADPSTLELCDLMCARVREQAQSVAERPSRPEEAPRRGSAART